MSELEAVIDGISPVLKDYVSSSVTPLIDRVKALEALPTPRDGKDGAPGEKGADGAPGERGPEGPIPEGWETRMAAIEASLAPESDDLVASFTGLLKKELADLDSTAPAIVQKHIRKDGAGGFIVTEER